MSKSRLASTKRTFMSKRCVLSRPHAQNRRQYMVFVCPGAAFGARRARDARWRCCAAAHLYFHSVWLPWGAARSHPPKKQPSPALASRATGSFWSVAQTSASAVHHQHDSEVRCGRSECLSRRQPVSFGWAEPCRGPFFDFG